MGQKSASGATSRSQRSQRASCEGSGFIVLGASARRMNYSSLALLQQQADPLQPFVLTEQPFLGEQLHQGAQAQLDGRLVVEAVEGLCGNLRNGGAEGQALGDARLT